MANATVTGAEFKTQLREGTPKMGLFLNSHSPTRGRTIGPQRL